MMKRLQSFLPRLWANWITLLGTSITTLSGVALLLVLALAFAGGDGNPYIGAILLLSLPAVFLAGLLLIPLGLWVDRRRQRREATLDGGTKRRLAFVGIASLVNVMLFGMGAQQAVHYMESPKFCGTSCHTVMQPEWENYQDSKHSHVACVQCHVGPGAKWAFKAKINGLHQVWGVLAGNHHRPVPSPVEQLRPSRDTCEQCHWPAKFTGNKPRIYPHYKDDKDNTPIWNAMLLHVGGRNRQTGKYEGIHWHASPSTQVKYEVLDDKRLKVGKIQVFDDGKLVAEYGAPEKEKSTPVRSVRAMDCIDCHNRPTHAFELSPTFAADRALYAGGLDSKTPWMAKVSVELLKSKDVPRDGAEAYFRKAIEEKYAKEHPEVKPATEVFDRAAKSLADLWTHNNYPAMKITWGTYKAHAGHRGEGDEVLGCFRCHDLDHEKTLPDGSKQSLGQDCETCHEPLAQDEDPAKFDDSLKAMVGKRD